MFNRILIKVPKLSTVVPVIIALCYIAFFMAAPFALAEEGLFVEPLSDECVDAGACDKCDLIRLISAIASGTLKVVGPIGVFCVALSGFFYMISAGKMGGESNIQGVARAKMALSASIVGIIIAVTAWLIVDAILAAVGYKGFGSSWNTITC